MNGQPDPRRAQILRQQCNRSFSGRSLHDVVIAIQMLTADAVIDGLPGLSEEQALSVANAIAGDIQNIIRERFALAGSKGH